MREGPILFSAPMVLALLDDAKAQTRRIVKWRGVAPGLNLGFSGLSASATSGGWVLEAPNRTSSEWRSKVTPCPYGVPGDRLWVRETFWAFGRWETRFSEKKGRDEWHFVDMTLETDRLYQFSNPTPGNRRVRSSITPTWWKRPSIHMPRVASRITLEMTGVRVERLQSISEADAEAEGCDALPWHGHDLADLIDWPLKSAVRPFANAYALLWDEINGAGSWATNPWVWCVSFKRVER